MRVIGQAAVVRLSSQWLESATEIHVRRKYVFFFSRYFFISAPLLLYDSVELAPLLLFGQTKRHETLAEIIKSLNCFSHNAHRQIFWTCLTDPEAIRRE